MKKLFLLGLMCISCSMVSAQVSSGGLGFARINHLALQVKDIPASRDFYRDVVGMKPVEVPDTLKAIRAWFDAGDGQMIHLLAGRTTPVVNDKNGGHFALFVVSIAGAEKFLTEKKITFHKQVRFDGVTQIYFADPDGYLIELNEKKK
jgi:catechol 2,3-dioxygenase-like lactoylglutathione lyase family enzyme